MSSNYNHNIDPNIHTNVQYAPYGYQTNTQIPIPKKTRGSAAKVVALALCCSLVGGACGAGGFAAYEYYRDGGIANIMIPQAAGDADTSEAATMRVGEREDSKIKTVNVDTSKTLTAAEIYAANVNSTVGIKTSVTTNYFGYQTQAAAAGSGFIFTSDGYVVTNYHVVENAESIQVTTYDNKTYDAKLVGYDESNDVAVLKIEASGLTPVVLGNSDNMNVGDDVVAIGNPLGELTFSLTSGAVSALNRNITIENTSMSLIQTDCAINAGNSGGALFNSHGEVIGITNAKYSSSNRSSASIDNIGFAIPMNSVRDIITSIIEKGYIEKVYIGVTVYSTNTQGVIVESVENGGPAEEAGIKSGDIIMAVGDKTISRSSDLKSALAQYKAGDSVTITINRDGETLKIKVALGVRQQAALPEKDSSSDDQAYPGGQSGQGSQSFPGRPEQKRGDGQFDTDEE